MENPDQLDDQILEALTHLYDPDYVPPAGLIELVGVSPEDGPLPVQSALLHAIQELEPRGVLSDEAHLARVYEVLHRRFVAKLTQEKTAELMDISVRHLNRVQREAVHTLARRLWERRRDRGRAAVGSELQAGDWEAQIGRELAALQARAPGAVADVGETLAGVLSFQGALGLGEDRVEVGFVQPDLAAALNASVLRQILITAIGRFVRYQGERGHVTVFAGLENGEVRITIAGAVGTRADEADLRRALAGDVLTPTGVGVEVLVEEGAVFVTIRMPSAAQRLTVLAVDDNADMGHFYRRCTVGTRYQLVHLGAGEGVLEAVRAIQPDVIVLDVMLPDVDGWQVLMHLHEDPTTRSIPVVICTVVREEELALSLGASGFLAKPVRPREFIQALDQALLRAQEGV